MFLTMTSVWFDTLGNASWTVTIWLARLAA